MLQHNLSSHNRLGQDKILITEYSVSVVSAFKKEPVYYPGLHSYQPPLEHSLSLKFMELIALTI